jgi:hypothetical protein
MKRFIAFVGLILLLTLLSSCSSKPSVQLINSRVSIIKDKGKLGSIGITEGDKKGQELVPTALYYEFTIKNAGNKKIGDIDNKGLRVKIEPNDKLVTISKETVGFNIFNPSSYEGTGVGYGSSFTSILKPGEEGKFTLSYELGVSEENPQIPLIVPSTDKLKKLEDNALDATLVLMLENKEIARFSLIKK